MKFVTVGIISIFIFCILLLLYIPIRSYNPTEKVEKDLGEIQLLNKTLRSHTLEVVEIDSCEYILLNTEFDLTLAHKGNCKYCLKRNLK